MAQTTQAKPKTKSKKVGSVLTGENGGFYIKFSEEVEVVVTDYKSGKSQKVKSKFLNLEKPQDTIKRLAEMGIITEEQAQERLENVPAFVKYDVSVSVPQK